MLFEIRSVLFKKRSTVQGGSPEPYMNGRHSFKRGKSREPAAVVRQGKNPDSMLPG
jgi:hypothetical protein